MTTEQSQKEVVNYDSLKKQYDLVVANNLKKESENESLRYELNRNKDFVNDFKHTYENKGYRLGRKVILGIHTFLSVALMLSGPILWKVLDAPPHVCLLLLPGIVWLGVVTTLIFELADSETRKYY